MESGDFILYLLDVFFGKVRLHLIFCPTFIEKQVQMLWFHSQNCLGKIVICRWGFKHTDSLVLTGKS